MLVACCVLWLAKGNETQMIFGESSCSAHAGMYFGIQIKSFLFVSLQGFVDRGDSMVNKGFR